MTIRRRNLSALLSTAAAFLFAGTLHAVPGEPQNQIPAGNSDLRVYELLAGFGQDKFTIGTVLIPSVDSPDGEYTADTEYWRLDPDVLTDLPFADQLRFQVVADVTWTEEEDASTRAFWLNWAPREGVAAVWTTPTEGDWKPTERPPEQGLALFSRPAPELGGGPSYLQLKGRLFETGEGRGIFTWWFSIPDGWLPPGDGFVDPDVDVYVYDRVDKEVETFQGVFDAFPFRAEFEDVDAP